MSFICPVCGKSTKTVSNLFLHLTNIRDDSHEKWLECYCEDNEIFLPKIHADRLRGNTNAIKPLTDLFKRDFQVD